jgi:hypothetical protein
VLGRAEGLLDRALCVVGAVAFTQLPEFIQQYLQRLGGHLDEARRQVESFTQVAAASKITLAQLIERTRQTPDEAVAQLSRTMSDAVARVDHLAAADAAIRNASPWTKPFVFLTNVDGDIARGTWDIYQPAVPTTAEGVVYAGLGILMVWALYAAAIRYPITFVLERRRRA